MAGVADTGRYFRRRPFEVEGRGYERDEEVCFDPEGEVVDGPCDIAW